MSSIRMNDRRALAFLLCALFTVGCGDDSDRRGDASVTDATVDRGVSDASADAEPDGPAPGTILEDAGICLMPGAPCETRPDDFPCCIVDTCIVPLGATAPVCAIPSAGEEPPGKEKQGHREQPSCRRFKKARP